MPRRRPDDCVRPSEIGVCTIPGGGMPGGPNSNPNRHGRSPVLAPVILATGGTRDYVPYPTQPVPMPRPFPWPSAYEDATRPVYDCCRLRFSPDPCRASGVGRAGKPDGLRANIHRQIDPRSREQTRVNAGRTTFLDEKQMASLQRGVRQAEPSCEVLTAPRMMLLDKQVGYLEEGLKALNATKLRVTPTISRQTGGS